MPAFTTFFTAHHHHLRQHQHHHHQHKKKIKITPNHEQALPESVTGPVRVVSYGCGDDDDINNGFGVLDVNTCCGTHVHTSAHLQAIKLIKVDGNNNNNGGGGGGGSSSSSCKVGRG